MVVGGNLGSPVVVLFCGFSVVSGLKEDIAHQGQSMDVLWVPSKCRYDPVERLIGPPFLEESLPIHPMEIRDAGVLLQKTIQNPPGLFVLALLCQLYPPIVPAFELLNRVSVDVNDYRFVGNLNGRLDRTVRVKICQLFFQPVGILLKIGQVWKEYRKRVEGEFNSHGDVGRWRKL
jgi:hypothetical protein